MTPDDIDAAARRSSTRWVVFLVAVDVFTWLVALAFATRGPHFIMAALVAWSALSLAAVCVLYARAIDGTQNPGPLLKGDRSPWLQPLFFPYRFVAWSLTALARSARLREPAISEIGPGLFMGVRLFPHEGDKLASRNIRHIVDLTCELPTNQGLSRAPFERLGVPTLDRCPPTLDQIASIADWAAERHAAGEAVYVHCAFGRGRSATVTAAIVLRLGWAHDAASAVSYVAAKRPVIRVRGAQLAALVKYAERASRPGPVAADGEAE
jgi:protein-tyrosine phosphatase